MVGDQLDRDHGRGRQRGHLHSVAPAGDESDATASPAAAALTTVCSQSRPGSWPQIENGESRPAW